MPGSVKGDIASSFSGSGSSSETHREPDTSKSNRMWKANKGPGGGSGVPGGAKNQARGIDMIDKGTDRIPRRWSTLKAVTWKYFIRESVVDPETLCDQHERYMTKQEWVFSYSRERCCFVDSRFININREGGKNQYARLCVNIDLSN